MNRFLVALSAFSILNPFTTYKMPTTSSVDVTEMKITEIQQAVDDGYLTYENIMRIYLERIEKYNEKYNAVLTLNKDALKLAKEKDQEYKKSGRTSMVFGLPILVKDNIDVKGLPTTAGTKALKDNYPKKNAPVIQKLIDAGAIIIGKTNMSEFALSADNSYSSYGDVKNAYNTNYSSYGSSGGTAVGVAANLAVAGLGTDTGGSVRIPSAANNLIGLRPTHDSINGQGVINYEETRDVVGPITKYVEDNAILLNIIDNKDTDYTKSLNKKNLNGIKIGVVRQFTSVNSNKTGIAQSSMDLDVYSLINRSIQTLKSLGAEIVYIDDFYNGYYSYNYELFCYDFNQYLKNTEGSIRSYSDLVNNGGYVSNMNWVRTNWCDKDFRDSSEFKNREEQRENFRNSIKSKFEKYDVDAVIYPTIRNKQMTYITARTSSTKTAAYAIAPPTGYPSMNLQIGKINKLSYGMELLSLNNKETTLYNIASVYENKTNYYNNPSISPNLYEVSSELKELKNSYDQKDETTKSKVTKELLFNYKNENNHNLKEGIYLSLYKVNSRR